MKEICLLLLVSGFFLSACNNEKGNDTGNNSNREKDDYQNNGKNDGKDYSNDKNDKNSDQWSASDVRSFNSQCQKTLDGKDLSESQLDQICSCLLEKMKDKYSSLEEMDDKSTYEEGKAAGEQCMAGLTNSDNNEGAGWTEKEEGRFINECETSARKKGDAEAATLYCDCMLQKTKKRFSSYNGADKGLLQMPEGELQKWMDDCNGK